MSQIFFVTIQIVIALGLLNVWLLRANLPSIYRGGDSKTIREEFTVYGLPGWFCSLVGLLKVSSALALLIGLWIPALVLPASIIILSLMLGAVLMHAKVRDPIIKTLPAAAMLILSLIMCLGSVGAI